MRKKSFLVVIAMLVATMLLCVACGKKSGGGENPGDKDDDITYSLSQTTLTLATGEEKTLTVTPAPESVAWSSSDSSIATVANGVVKGVYAGTATVTAQIPGEDPLTCAVTVQEYTINYDVLSLVAGGNAVQLSVTSNGAAVQGVTYASSDATVASVSESGLVTPLANGNAVITATADGHAITCKVSVHTNFAYELNATELHLAAGATGTLGLNAPAEGEPALHTFNSSDTSVVTVNPATGAYTAVGAGKAQITCTVDGVALDCEVTVTQVDIAGTLQIGKGEDSGRTLSELITMTGETLPITSAESDTTANVQLTSGAVSGDTKIYGVAAGKATVTIVIGGRSFEIEVTVVGAYVFQETDITIVFTNRLGTDATQKINEAQLVAQTASGGTPSATFTYTSSHPEVATVDSTGKVTAVSLGETTITATPSDGTDDVICNITVKMPTPQASSVEAKQDQAFYNLSVLDGKKSLDWHYYYAQGNDNAVHKMVGSNLIGNVVSSASLTEANYDCNIVFAYTNGDAATNGEALNGVYGRRNVRVVRGDYSIPVTVNNKVEKIVLFTGKWDATNTVSLTLDEEEAGSVVLGKDSSPRYSVVTFALDPSYLADGATKTAKVNVTLSDKGGKALADLIAIAVVSNEEAETAKATVRDGAQITKTNMDAASVTNLTEEGTFDWVHTNAQNCGDHKASVPAGTVIDEANVAYAGDTGSDWYGAARFSWSDGGVYGSSVGKGDQHVEADRDTVNAFKWVGNGYAIPVHLPKGAYTVNVYSKSWDNNYSMLALDGDGNYIGGIRCQMTRDNGNSHAFKVTFPLSVSEETTVWFHAFKQCAEGNLGWASVSVSNDNGFALINPVANLSVSGTQKGEVTVADASALTGTGTAPSLTSASVLAQSPVTAGQTVVTFDETNSKFVAENPGTAVVAFNYGTFTLYGAINVTEYVLANTSVTLHLEQKYTPEITMTPSGTLPSFTVTPADTNILTVSGTELTAKASGNTTATITIAGVTLTLDVTVREYMLLASGTAPLTDGVISKELTSSDLNNTITTLSVTKNGAAYTHVEYASSDAEVAAVGSSDGVITAKGLGEATITVTVKDETDTNTLTTLTCTVKFYLTLNKTDITSPQATVNLTELDATKETLDWRYFGGDGYNEAMVGASLIGDPAAADASFWDYNTRFTFANGENGAILAEGRQDGACYKGDNSRGTTFTVKVDANVDRLVIFTGAWHAKNTVTVQVAGRTAATAEFENKGDADNIWKNVRMDLSLANAPFVGETTLTVSLAVGGESSNGWTDNVSLIAVAVVGKNARATGEAAATATVEKAEITKDGDARRVIVLSDNTDDWWYSHCEHDPSTKKAMAEGDEHIILGNNATSQLDGGHWVRMKKEWNFENAVFNWTGGDNHATHYEDNDVGDAKGTDNTFAGQDHSMAFNLPVGTHKIVMYVRAWDNVQCYGAVCDKYGNEIGRTVLADGSSAMPSHTCYAITYTVTVTEAGYFATRLVVTAGGNLGLAAVTVTLNSAAA